MGANNSHGDKDVPLPTSSDQPPEGFAVPEGRNGDLVSGDHDSGDRVGLREDTDNALHDVPEVRIFASFRNFAPLDPQIYFDDFIHIPLPLSPSHSQTLLAKGGRLSADQFRLRNPYWAAYVKQLCDT